MPGFVRCVEINSNLVYVVCQVAHQPYYSRIVFISIRRDYSFFHNKAFNICCIAYIQRPGFECHRIEYFIWKFEIYTFHNFPKSGAVWLRDFQGFTLEEHVMGWERSVHTMTRVPNHQFNLL